MEQTDSTQTPGEQVANPVSSGNGDQPNSFNPEKFAKDLEARILAAVRDPREVQSLKDRAVAEIKKDKGLREVFAELKQMQEAGLSDAEIQREIRIRELEARLPEPAAPVQSAGRVVEPTANNPVSTLISALQLDANAPEVTGILMQGDLTEQLVALSALAVKKKNSPSPAAVSQPAGSGAPRQSLLEEYQAAAKNTRGNALIDLKMEYRRKGLDIN